MKKMGWTTLMPLFIIGIVFIAAPAGAGDIKARMKARLPEIKALKASGAVGENNTGYLQVLGGKTANANVVEAENKDRGKVYEFIAKQQKTTIDVVGKQRARTIRNNARSGEWIQTEDGKWRKK